jgi:hypothetical protein
MGRMATNNRCSGESNGLAAVNVGENSVCSVCLLSLLLAFAVNWEYADASGEEWSAKEGDVLLDLPLPPLANRVLSEFLD